MKDKTQKKASTKMTPADEGFAASLHETGEIIVTRDMTPDYERESKRDQAGAMNKAIIKLIRFRHGAKRTTMKTLATHRRSFGWGGDESPGGYAHISIDAPGGLAIETYEFRLNATALREVVRNFDEHQSPENKIGRAP
jgi:hypothetical protein